MSKSGAARCMDAIRAGRSTIREISIYAHLSEQDTRTYLTRLKNRGLIESAPVTYRLKK